MKKLRLKRHGSFSIREGWFEKAIDSIRENDKSVFSKASGVATLGIGANMVTSLRFWMIASEVITENNSMFTEFGDLLVEYDPYLESDFSWWMIHHNLVSNFENAPVFNIVFNHFNIKNFNKDIMNQFVINYMEENGYDMSNSSLVDADTTVLLRTYINEKIKNPEDNLSCPLGKLGILMKNTDGSYNFIQPNHETLPYEVVYYSLLKCIDEDEIKGGINIDDLINKYNSPSRIFKLDKNLLHMYLNKMKQAGLVTINKTAGLNMLYIQKIMSEKEIFDNFFMRSNNE